MGTNFTLYSTDCDPNPIKYRYKHTAPTIVCWDMSLNSVRGSRVEKMFSRKDSLAEGVLELKEEVVPSYLVSIALQKDRALLIQLRQQKRHCSFVTKLF